LNRTRTSKFYDIYLDQQAREVKAREEVDGWSFEFSFTKQDLLDMLELFEGPDSKND